MEETAKIADLTVEQFRALMQECFDADRRALTAREHERGSRQLALHPGSSADFGGMYAYLNAQFAHDAK